LRVEHAPLLVMRGPSPAPSRNDRRGTRVFLSLRSSGCSNKTASGRSAEKQQLCTRTEQFLSTGGARHPCDVVTCLQQRTRMCSDALSLSRNIWGNSSTSISAAVKICRADCGDERRQSGGRKALAQDLTVRRTFNKKLFESLNKTLRPCCAIESGHYARSEMWQRQLQSIDE
jgi:hypothetical protein